MRATGTHEFKLRPTAEDFTSAAEFVATAQQHQLHAELWPRRTAVSQRLLEMAQHPTTPSHIAAYQTLRLLVY